MKELDFVDFTLIEYDNDNIYKYERYIQRCCLISLIMAIISALVYISVNTIRKTWVLEFLFYISFFNFLLLPPLFLFLQSRGTGRRPSEFSKTELDKIRINAQQQEGYSKKSNTHFPFASTILSFLFFEFIKIIMLFIVGLTDIPNYFTYMRIWANHLGQMFLSTLFIYIALIFQIKRCILIKSEWDANPPRFVQEAIMEKQNEQKSIIEQKNFIQYKELIEKCGFKFFIKYYKQVKRLPLRDIEIAENYSSAEREERLIAAKKIIELNLTEFTLNQILISYSDVLNDSETSQLKSILAEIEAQK